MDLLDLFRVDIWKPPVCKSHKGNKYSVHITSMCSSIWWPRGICVQQWLYTNGTHRSELNSKIVRRCVCVFASLKNIWERERWVRRSCISSWEWNSRHWFLKTSYMNVENLEIDSLYTNCVQISIRKLSYIHIPF